MNDRIGLWNFDNDGTLSNTANYHILGWGQTIGLIGETRGKLIIEGRVMDSAKGRIGYSESKMAEELLQEFGLPASDLDSTIQTFRRKLDGILETQPIDVLPYAREFLRDLKERGHYTGIVTGNSSGYGRKVLDRAGLSPNLDVFAFADGLSSKPEIARRAISLAEERGLRYDFVVALGDNKVDIEGGKAVGAFTVGVLTGVGKKEDFRKAGADLVIPDLTHYPRIYEALGVKYRII